MGNFSGMLFTLKKREQNIAEDDSKFYKQLMLGYYDGLDIHTVNQWYDLRPKGLLKRNLQVDLDSPFIDQYTIRTFIPENSEELDKSGFDYKLWKNIGTYSAEEYDNYDRNFRETYPFIFMSVLNVTEKLVKELNSLQEIEDALVIELKKSVNKLGYDLADLHCAVFPSIGYSDFIILFMTKIIKSFTGIQAYVYVFTDKFLISRKMYQKIMLGTACKSTFLTVFIFYQDFLYASLET